MDFLKHGTSFLSVHQLRSLRVDDLWTDQLSHRYSVALFAIFATILTSNQFVGKPIDCWGPSEFRPSYEKYAESLCWINGTYYIGHDKHEIPTDPTQRYSNRIRYYQWTPFILFFQAVLMYLPRLFWTSFNSKSGLNIHHLVDAAKKYETLESFSQKEQILKYFKTTLYRYILFFEFVKAQQYPTDRQNKTKLRSFSHFNERNNSYRVDAFDDDDRRSMSSKQIRNFFKELLDPKLSKNYLIILYFIYKLIYFCNTFGQIYMLSYIIGKDYALCGYNFFNSFINGDDWKPMAFFPRLSICEIYIREIGQVHLYVIQCILRINLFNEVIFIFMWYWLVILLLIKTLDLLYFIFYMINKCHHSYRKTFSKKHLYFNTNRDTYLDLIESKLCANESMNSESEKIIIVQEKASKIFRLFYRNIITNDLIFVFKIIQRNSSCATVSDVLKAIWLEHIETNAKKY